MTQLTAHFSLAELTETSHRTLGNTCPPELLPNLVDAAAMLERVRAALTAYKGFEVAIYVTSGYRSPAVNAAVGGSPHSDHIRAWAVDFKAPDFGTPYQVATFLAPRINELGIGQLILEFDRWVHVSIKRPDKQVNSIITYRVAGEAEVGIVQVAA